MPVTTGVTSFSASTTGRTPATPRTGAVTLAGALVAGNGGTGLTAAGTLGNALISNGTAWTSAAIPSSAVNLTGPITSVGAATAIAAQTGTGSTFVVQTSPALITPALGTPASADFTTIAATQAQQETATALTAPVTPGRQQFHPSAAKFWVVADPTGTITASYNVTSISDGGVGILGVIIDTDFSSANWTGAAQVQENANAMACKFSSVVAAGSCEIRAYTTTAGVLTDPNRFFVQGFGDQ